MSERKYAVHSALSRGGVQNARKNGRLRALENSENVSRRSEERPLISANEVLRFPLNEFILNKAFTLHLQSDSGGLDRYWRSIAGR